jgi:hypothetical protein
MVCLVNYDLLRMVGKFARGKVTAVAAHQLLGQGRALRGLSVGYAAAAPLAVV